MKKIFKAVKEFFQKMFGKKRDRHCGKFNIETDEYIIVQDDIDIEEWEAGEPVSESDVKPEPSVYDDEILTYGSGVREGKFFTVSELCASSTAKAKGIRNVPDETETKHLVELITNLLDPIREAWGDCC